MANVPATTVLSLPSLSDLLTVKTDTATNTNNRLFQHYLLDRREAVIILMSAVREQTEAADVALTMYACKAIGDETFLMAINNNFALLAGYRCFLLHAVEYILQADGAKPSEEGRTILLLAEQELEKQMERVLFHVHAATAASPFNLHWEEGQGLFLHKPLINSDEIGEG